MSSLNFLWPRQPALKPGPEIVLLQELLTDSLKQFAPIITPSAGMIEVELLGHEFILQTTETEENIRWRVSVRTKHKHCVLPKHWGASERKRTQIVDA